MMEKIVEEGAVISATQEDVLTKDMPVFYNPLMKLNRDMSIILLRALGEKDMLIADPLAGSGIRSIRFLQELPGRMIKRIFVNDRKEVFVRLFKENAKESGVGLDKISISSEDANLFLYTGKPFHYIDIDPFGSPNPFLDSAVRRTRRGGILAITATDTAPLCGTYPKACMRKYWAKPLHDYRMHEMGLRILIRKCQLVGAQFDKALIPIFSYSLNHYFRVFFRVENGKGRVDRILSQHDFFEGAGPMWVGRLSDPETIIKMVNVAKKRFPQHVELLNTIRSESQIDNVGFLDLHEVARELRLSGPLRTDHAIKILEEKGIEVSKTHFYGFSLRVSCSNEEAISIIKEAIDGQ